MKLPIPLDQKLASIFGNTIQILRVGRSFFVEGLVQSAGRSVRRTRTDVDQPGYRQRPGKFQDIGGSGYVYFYDVLTPLRFQRDSIDCKDGGVDDLVYRVEIS